MKRFSPSRLTRLLSDMAALEKANGQRVGGELADAQQTYEDCVNALSSPFGNTPPALAALSSRSVERRILEASQAQADSERKLHAIGCQLKLHERRAAKALAVDRGKAQREQLIDVIERLATASPK